MPKIFQYLNGISGGYTQDEINNELSIGDAKIQELEQVINGIKASMI